MSTWRRKALELFPECRKQLLDPDASVYWVFFDLLPLAKQAHKHQDTEFLTRVHQFAQWCFAQQKRAPDVMNAACTAFYEHLADHEDTWWDIPTWVPPAIFEVMRNEFEQRMERKAPGTYSILLKRYNEVNGTDFQ